MMQEEFLLHGATASTGGCAVLVVLNGPIRLELGAGGTFNALGNSDRATAVIGRAIRLCLINLLDVRPGGIDRSTLGHPGKFSYCVAEDEEDTTWQSLSEQRGLPSGGLGGHGDGGGRAAPDHERVDDRARGDPGDLRRRDARQPAALFDPSRQLRASSSPSSCASTCRRPAGARRDIADFIHERARIHRREWAEVGKGAVVRDRGDSVYPALESPDQLLVIAAGGPAGGFGAVIPPWLGNKSHAVTLPIGACVDCEPPKK